MTYLVFAILFICLQGFFAGMETGMVSVLRPRVEHAARTSNSSSARLMHFFVSKPSIMISTTLIGVNISVVCASLCAKKFMEYCGLSGGTGILVSTAILSVILLSCEIIPKNFFRQAPFKRCSGAVHILYGTYIVLYLPIRLFASFTDFLNTRLLGKSNDVSGRQEEFKLFLRESEGAGSVDSETASILEKAMRIPSLRIGDILIPREKVIELSSKVSIREAFDTAVRFSVKHLPVYIQTSESEESSSRVRWYGIFNVYDAIFSLDESLWETTGVTSCLAHIHTLRETDGVREAIDMASRHNVTLFVTLDADGRQSGIVSPDDIASLLFK